MSFLRPLRPLTASFLGLSLPWTRPASSAASATASTCTRFLWRQPSPAAPRESPFPLVFVRARNVPGDTTDETKWADWSGMFAEKGYTGIEIDITAPSGETSSSSSSGSDFSSGVSTPGKVGTNEEFKSVLDSMTTMLASQIRLMAIPFAPIIISSGPSSTALTQNYISSHPASGLVLVNPSEGEREESMFNYEPSFPILVINDRGEHGGRLGQAAIAGVGRGGKGVDVERIVDGERGEKTRVVSYSLSPNAAHLLVARNFS